ncbi:tetratricopeptide repeat protein [Sphingomonas sp. CJ20]
MRTGFLILAALPLVVGAVPALAQERTASDQIATGAYSDAERALGAELRIHPNRPELLLNLAAVYAKTGRTAQARALYSQVLSQDSVLMDLPADRVAPSHAVAQTGLKRLEAVQFTAR